MEVGPSLARVRLRHWLGRPWLRPVLWGLGLYVALEVVFGRAEKVHVLGIPFPHGVPLGILALGGFIGMLYGLLAFGLILVYRANRIINFAHAGLGLVPGVTGLLLITNRHWPYPAAFVVMLLGSALIGGLVEVLMRRFSNAPRLIATVVTIGFAEVFVVLELNLGKWIGGSSGITPISFPSPYAKLHFTLGGVVFTGDYLAILVVSAAICAGLAAFLRYSRAGIAIRASAENPDRASLLGVPVARLSLLVWVIAGVCSGLAVFLQAPAIGLPTGGAVSPLILLYGLAAAVIGRMESLPVAFGAGIGIGMVQQASIFGSNRPDDAAALMLPVILGALLLQRRRGGRASDTGISGIRTLAEFRPIPVQLRHLPEVIRARRGLVAAAVVAAVAAPLVFGESRDAYISIACTSAMISVSLVILSGWAGQISLGQVAFAGLGAAVAGGLAARHGTDFFVTLIAAALVGAGVSLLIGIPALRVPGLFLSVVTLGFAATVAYAVLSPERFGWLLPKSGQYIERPLLYNHFDLSSNKAYCYVVIVFLGLAILSARSIRRSRSGRVLIAVRDNPRAAQSYGVDATRAKLAAFAVSGAIAAVAGALSAYQSQVSANTFGMEASLTAFLFAVVGGLTSVPGAVIGTIAFEVVGFLGGPNLKALATGVGATFVLYVFPGGLAQVGYQWRDDALRWLARRKDIHVPSLLADSRVEEAEPEPDTAALLTAASKDISGGAIAAPDVAVDVTAEIPAVRA